MDYWNGLLEWTLTFFFSPRGNYIATLRNLFRLTLAHAGLACKVVLARAVPKDSTQALDMKPCPRPTARDDPLPNNIVFAELQMSINIFTLL